MNKNTKGIIFIILSALFFALMNTFVHLSGDIHTFQKVFFRNAVAVIFAFVILLRNKASFKPAKKGNLKYLLLRTLFGATGMLCNFYCLDRMLVSDASILNKMSPFFAILFSFLIVKERPRLYQWVLIFGAFVGAAFVIKPTIHGFSDDVMTGLIGLLGGACAGIAYSFVRKLGTLHENGAYIVFFFSLVSTVIMAPGMIVNFKNVTAVQWIILIFTGVFAALGQLCITYAYTHASPKDISIYDYTQILFASALGFIFFAQVPDIYSIIGYIIIVSMAVLNFLLQRSHK